MFHRHPLGPDADLQTSPLALARGFMVEHGDALATAADLLGGRPAFGRYCRLVTGLRRGSLSARQIQREFTYLYELLRLERVGDLDGEETGVFALIDPGSPEVHEMCLLTEAVERLLAALERLSSAKDARSEEPLAKTKRGRPTTGQRLSAMRPHGLPPETEGYDTQAAA